MAKNLYGKEQELLLSKGQVLKESYVHKIRAMGYSGVYIDDDISKDIEIVSFVDEKIKMSTVTAVKDIFIASEQEDIQRSIEMISNAKELVKNIVDDILANDTIMVNMVDLKVFDDYTFYHCVNVAVLSIVTGISLEMNRSDLYNLGLASLLHDIGKVFIEKNVLNKPGKLTDEEFGQIKRHPLLGYDYLTNHFDIPLKSSLGVLHHQERFDGSGYPSHLSGKQISIIGRVIAISDVYDALTSDRPYRKAMLPSNAMEYIMGGSGSMFDPKIVHSFTRKVAPYPLGTCVRLSDGTEGIVTENFEDCCIRPKIRVLKAGPACNPPTESINLKDDPHAFSLTIVEVVKM